MLCAMTDTPDLELQRQLAKHFSAALDATISAIRAELAKDRKPRGKRSEPSFYFRDNGMPSLSDGSVFENRGPLQYADLLEPMPGAGNNPFHRQKFDEGRFAEVDALAEFVRANPGCARSNFPSSLENPSVIDIIRVQLEIQLAHAANHYFQRYGNTPLDCRKRTALLGPIFRGFFNERVNITDVIPIALVKFDFDRLRLADDAYIFRMSEALQKKRWAAKAYGASGHDGVVAAATHAFAITGWHWPNVPWMQMPNNLAGHTPMLRERIEELFAALRLVSGVSTGYAQEARVARGWRHLHSDQPPEVYAAGARRYPEEFDDFGWMRDDLPTVTREQMRETASVLTRIAAIEDQRLTLALRRMNGAMIRSDVADTILDATIALEILLSDGDSQAVGYKLRMRAGALANLAEPGGAAAVSAAIKQIYEARSRIVHGARQSKKRDTALAGSLARDTALKTLRNILQIVIAHPRYLDPLKIDAELLLA